MSETLLTLDIGVTTGWAIFQGRQLMDYSQTTVLSETLPQVLEKYNPDIVISEIPIIFRGPLGDQLDKVVTTARSFLIGSDRTVIECEPSDWKPTPAAKMKCPKGTSQHEKDDIRMGYCFIQYWLQGNKRCTNVPG